MKLHNFSWSALGFCGIISCKADNLNGIFVKFIILNDISRYHRKPSSVKIGHREDCQTFCCSFFSLILYSLSPDLTTSSICVILLLKERCFERWHYNYCNKMLNVQFHKWYLSTAKRPIIYKWYKFTRMVEYELNFTPKTMLLTKKIPIIASNKII